MIENMPTGVILALFYITFAVQILFASVYLPAKTLRRIDYVREHFPKEDYPNLYAGGSGSLFTKVGGARALYRRSNYIIAIIGLALLVAMYVSGFQPHPMGGSEIYVVAYFILQSLPIIILGVCEYQQLKGMRAAFSNAKRSANLAPRRLFDFVAPVWVVLAVVAFLGWVAFFAYDLGFDAPWRANHYFSLATITAVNVGYAIYIAKVALVKKHDPYKAAKDHQKQVAATVQSLVFSSTIMSVFLIMTTAADRFGFEILDPVMTSIFLQACLLFGYNMMLNMQPVDDLDFEVYKNGAAAE